LWLFYLKYKNFDPKIKILTLKLLFLIEIEVFKVPLFQIRRNELVTFKPGLPFGLFKGQICPIWPFLKLFARNKMVWPFGHFWPFLNVDKKSIF